MAHRENIRMEIGLEHGSIITPGSSFMFCLAVTTNRPIKILNIEAVLESHGQLLRTTQGWVGVNSVVSTEVYARHRLSSDPGDSAYKHALYVIRDTEGHHISQNIHEDLPPTSSSTAIVTVTMDNLKDIPDTYMWRRKRFGVRISNVLRGKVTYRPLDRDPEDGPGVPAGVPEEREDIETRYLELTARADVQVRNSRVSIEDLRHHPRIAESLRQVQGEWEDGSLEEGFSMFRQRIKCELKALDNLGVVGREFPLEVEISNTNPKELKVSLSLFTVLSIMRPNSSEAVEEMENRLLKVRLPNIPPFLDWNKKITGFTIPADCMNSMSLLPCSFITVRYFLRLKVKWTWMGTKKHDVNIHLGTQGTQRPSPPSTLTEYRVGESH